MKKQIVYFLLILFPLLSFGQKPKFEVSVSKNSCKVGERIQLIIFSNMKGDLELPDLKNCKIVGGPSVSSSMQTIIINGRASVESLIYHVYEISFTKKGDQVIPPAKLTVGGKTYHSEPITVKVGTGEASSEESADKNLYLTISLSKNKVYQGEHVVATYRLYTRYVQYRHNLEDVEFPSQKNVWTQEVESIKKLKLEEEIINGQRYGVVVFAKHLLIPQKSGKLKLEPFKVKWTVSDGWFNSENFNLTSNSPTLEVLPLPENAPESFNGAVGNFSFEVNYSKSELKVNDGLDITVKIKGNGNLKFLNEFNLELPDEMEKFDPEITDTINYSLAGMSGKRVFKYLSIPRASGKYKLKPIEFTYFDPESGKYKTLSSGEFELNVLKGDGTEDNTIIKKQGTVKVLNKEIRHLRPYEDDIRVKGDYLFGSALFYGLFLSGPLAFILFVFIRKKTQKSDSQMEQLKVKRATKIAIRQMQHAKTLLDKKDIEGFYAEAMKTLYEYTGLKLGLPNSYFTKENIRKKLEEKKVGTETITDFVKIIEDCEMARFGGHHVGYENQLYNDSIRLIEKLEDKL